MSKKHTISICWFSSGDIVLIQKPGFQERYAVVDRMESDESVCVRAPMTGRSIHSADWRNAGHASGFIERRYHPSVLKVICRRPRYDIEAGDRVVAFPIVQPPHLSTPMQTKERVDTWSSWRAYDRVAMEGVGERSGKTIFVRSNLVYLPASHSQSLSVGDSVMLNHGIGRGLTTWVLEIDLEGMIGVNFGKDFRRNLYAMGDLLKLTPATYQQVAMSQCLPTEVEADRIRSPRQMIFDHACDQALAENVTTAYPLNQLTDELVEFS